MEFLVVQYTNRCGMRYEWVEANSIEECKELAVWPHGRDEDCAFVDGGLNELMIIPAQHVVSIDVDFICRKVKAEREAKKAAAKAVAELAEYQQLKEFDR